MTAICILLTPPLVARQAAGSRYRYATKEGRTKKDSNIFISIFQDVSKLKEANLKNIV
jgi:hypothetical protein